MATKNTQRRKPTQQQELDQADETTLPNITSTSLREIIRQEIDRALQDSIQKLVKEQFNHINESIANLQQSLNFFNSQYEVIKINLDSKTTTIDKLEKDNIVLQNEIKDITKRLNLMEQHARSNNIELHCVPEHKNENLVSSVLHLSNIIGCKIGDTDIQYCARIAKINRQNSRPRSILVKFNSPRQRDTFLAASMNYNRKNPKSKLNSSHLGISGDNPSPIYVAEHLSADNKALHAAARVRAKERGYKFVWVRNGRIFMKKDELSEGHVINDIEKLKSLS
ncbi:uncharacterized protein LOC142985926 [Anticarsia gemmatalis]|uniref:uncharacterized protein LOC142985926 n=1 Tax=Anticarsia gemmatalis TaxID=129554 RepID=UPI003F757C9A